MKCFMLLIIWDDWHLSKTYSFHYKVSTAEVVWSPRVGTPMGGRSLLT